MLKSKIGLNSGSSTCWYDLTDRGLDSSHYSSKNSPFKKSDEVTCVKKNSKRSPFPAEWKVLITDFRVLPSGPVTSLAFLLPYCSLSAFLVHPHWPLCCGSCLRALTCAVSSAWNVLLSETHMGLPFTPSKPLVNYHCLMKPTPISF